MKLNLKWSSLLILGITALVLSRTLFAFFDDPEGPNLLVVGVMAAIIYALSLTAYFFSSLAKKDSLKNILLLVLTQILIMSGFYFLLSWV